MAARRAWRPKVTVSVRRGRLPNPGAPPPHEGWDDVIGSPPPWHTKRAPAGSFVVRHAMVVERPDDDTRVGFGTVVRARTGIKGLEIDVDERVTVEPRLLRGVMRAERAVARTMGRRAAQGLSRFEAGSGALSRRVGGTPGVALERGSSIVVRVLRLLARLVQDAVVALVSAPDRLWVGATTAESQLTRRRDRKALLIGLGRPHELTREGKLAAVFLVAASAFALIVVATLVAFLVTPDLIPKWRVMVGLFARATFGTVLLPLFPEFAVRDAVATISPAVAIGTVVVGNLLGAWLVLLLGEEVNNGLRSIASESPQLTRALDAAEGFVTRYGFFAAFGILSIPLGPETPIYYTLATARTPLPQYFAGAFMGTVTRHTLFLTVWQGF